MAAKNPFATIGVGVDSPALDLVAITAADADLVTVLRYIRVGGAGDVAVRTVAGTTVVFPGCLAGEKLGPFLIDRVNATGTTATGLVGFV